MYGDVICACLFCLALLISISLIALLVYQCNLIRLNRTTVERQWQLQLLIMKLSKSQYSYMIRYMAMACSSIQY